MEVIYKYLLHESVTMVPEGEVLAVGFQNSQLTVWIKHSDPIYIYMKLIVAPTGEPISKKNLFHVGSAVSDNLVFHVFKEV